MRLLAKSCAVDMFTSRNWEDDVACVYIAALFFSERSVYESEFARIVGLIDEISIKRIQIAEKIRGHFLSICLWSQWFITPSCFDHIRNAHVFMAVDASCRLLLLFLSDSSQESMLWRTRRYFVVCRYSFRRYPRKRFIFVLIFL